MTMTRRALLAATAAGAGLAATGCSPLTALTALTAGQGPEPASVRERRGNRAEDVTGAFRWRRAQGSRLRVLLADAPSSRALREHLGTFTAKTGITVETTVLPEAEHFDEVTRQLVSGLPDVDVFMTGAPMVWQYAPPGWMEDLDPWAENPSATAPDHEPDDLLPETVSALRWDSVLGHFVGTGPLWAVPLTWETSVLAYRTDVLGRLGLRPPETFADLEEVSRATAAHLAGTVEGGYGLAVRGDRSWATVQTGMATQYAREGGRDYTVRAGHLVPDVTSPRSVDFHQRWSAMVRESASPRWGAQTQRECVADLGSGLAAMAYDTTAALLPLDDPALSATAGRLGFSPGPRGPGSDHTSNLWVWSLAVSSRSEHKLASWLFLQWAGGHEHVRWSATRHGIAPVRTSVLEDGAYRSSLAGHPGYLEAVDAVRPRTRITSTPTPSYFGTANAWAGAVQDMVSGSSAAASLEALAERMRQRG